MRRDRRIIRNALSALDHDGHVDLDSPILGKYGIAKAAPIKT